MALMKKHQMDITEFSEKCGIKEERVERLLGGRGKPSHLERMCIAEAFGMTEEELTGYRTAFADRGPGGADRRH